MAPYCLSLTLLLVTCWAAPSSAQGTPEQRQACMPDVFRLCSTFIPDADRITTCLRERNYQLTDACRQAVEPETAQMPSAAVGNSTPKRSAR